MLQGVLVRVRAMLRPHVARVGGGHSETRGATRAAYADRVIPVLMGLLPGFIVQRAVIADFDADAYVAAIPEAAAALTATPRVRMTAGQMPCQSGLFSQAYR